MKTMTEKFDYTEVFDQEIEPLLSKAWEKFKELNIPMVASVLYANGATEEEGVTRSKAQNIIHLAGRARTPLAFVIAADAIDGDFEKAAKGAVLAGLTTQYKDIERVPAPEVGNA